MTKKYYSDIRYEAADEYIQTHKTLKEIAEQFNITLPTITRWSRQDNWKNERKNFLEQRRQTAKNLRDLKYKKVQQALATGKNQDVYAALKLEKELQDKKNETTQPVTTTKRIIKTKDDAINAVFEVLENKLNTLLANPDTAQTSDLKQLKDSFELLDDLKAKHGTKKEKKGDFKRVKEALNNLV